MASTSLIAFQGGSGPILPAPPGAEFHFPQSEFDVVLDTALPLSDQTTCTPNNSAHRGKTKASYTNFQQKPSQNFASDPEVVLRVLCHRADRAASKYLKAKSANAIPVVPPGTT